MYQTKKHGLMYRDNAWANLPFNYGCTLVSLPVSIIYILK